MNNEWYSHLYRLDRIIIKYIQTFMEDNLVEEIVNRCWIEESFSLDSYRKTQKTVAEYYNSKLNSSKDLLKKLKYRYLKLKHEYVYYKLIDKARHRLLLTLKTKYE